MPSTNYLLGCSENEILEISFLQFFSFDVLCLISNFLFQFSRFDSIVSDEINYDLIMKAYSIQTGAEGCPELLGQVSGKLSKTTDNIPISLRKAYCGEKNC